jgi:hypothetical protein
MRLVDVKKICGKAIKKGDLGFTCFDCGIDRDSHLICETCFDKELHKNHKIKYSTDYIGSCDCGDFSAVLEKGTCKSHLGISDFHKRT